MPIDITATPPTTYELKKLRRRRFFLRPLCLAVTGLLMLPLSALASDVVAAVIVILTGCLFFGAVFESVINQAKNTYATINYRQYLKLADMTRASVVVSHYVDAVATQGRTLTNIEYAMLRAQVRNEERQASHNTRRA